MASTNRRQAANSSARSALTASGPAIPSSGASRARSQPRSEGSGSRSATAASSLAVTSAGGSDSRTPAWALTISPSAQKVIPSP